MNEFQSGARAALAAASLWVEVTTGNVSALVGFRQLTSWWLFWMEPKLQRMLVLFRVSSNAKCWRISLHITNHLWIIYFSVAEGINTRFGSTWKVPSDLFTWLVSVYNSMFSRAVLQTLSSKLVLGREARFWSHQLNWKYNFNSVCTLKINFLFSKAAVLKSTIYLHMHLNCILTIVGLKHAPGSFF